MNHHVLLVVSTLDGTGPGRIMSDLARGLSSAGHDVKLVATHGEISGELTRGLDPSSWDNLSMKSMFDIRGARKLERLARSFRPTVIHSRTFRADLVARRVARRLGVPLINNIVNVHPDDTFALHGKAKGRLVMFLYKATMPRDLSVVVNARALVEPTARVLHMDPSDLRVIHDGIDMRPFHEDVATGASPGGSTFVTSARLHPQKGLDVLIEAAPLVIRELPDASFLIAGTGPLQQELADLTVRHGVEDRVDLLGWCDDVPALLRGADVYVLPSRYEGLPGSVIEAMAAALPVIATRVAGIPELVSDGVEGRLVDPDDAGQLAAAMIELGRAPAAVRRQMGAAGAARANEQFSLKAMTASYLEVYSALAEPGGVREGAK